MKGESGEPPMKVEYRGWKWEQRMAIEVRRSEAVARPDPGRTDACPTCAQRVGVGSVRCRSCGDAFVIAFPHWHVHCNLAGGDCPACGVRYETPCVCCPAVGAAAGCSTVCACTQSLT